MNYPRAIGMAILTYLASMLIGMVINMIFQIDMTTEFGDIPLLIWLVSMGVLFGVTYLFATRYFKGTTVVASTQHGLLLGVVMLLVGFLLDMLFIQLYSLSPQAPAEYNRMEIYQNVWFWIGVIVMMGTSTWVGWKSGE